MENVELKEKEVQEESVDTPLDKNVRLMSPTRMLIRRFFRSKLSVAGLIMVVPPALRIIVFAVVSKYAPSIDHYCHCEEGRSPDVAISR